MSNPIPDRRPRARRDNPGSLPLSFDSCRQSRGLSTIHPGIATRHPGIATRVSQRVMGLREGAIVPRQAAVETPSDSPQRGGNGMSPGSRRGSRATENEVGRNLAGTGAQAEPVEIGLAVALVEGHDEAPEFADIAHGPDEAAERGVRGIGLSAQKDRGPLRARRLLWPAHREDL